MASTTKNKQQSEPAKKEEPPKQQEQQPSEGTDTARSDENKSPQGGKNKKVRQYFKAELDRVDQSIKKEAEKIHKPPEKEFSPELFNDLEPYQNLSTPRFVIEKPDEANHVDPYAGNFKVRATAQAMTEPWVALQMDVNANYAEEQKRAHAAANPPPKREPSPEKPTVRRERTDILQGTILPRYSIVRVDNPEMASRELTFDDVANIREDVRNKYMACSKQKVDNDYRVTTEDFGKLELDRLNEVRLRSQGPLRLAYFAYLQNTPGSKKAIRDCMKQFDKDHPPPKDEEEEKRKAQEEEEEDKKKKAQAKHHAVPAPAKKSGTKNDPKKSKSSESAEKKDEQKQEGEGQEGQEGEPAEQSQSASNDEQAKNDKTITNK